MIRLLVAIVLVGSCFVGRSEVFAHVPHDDVGDIELSPEFSRDQTIYATVRGELFKSTNGGYVWHRLFRGLGTCSGWLIELAMVPDYPADPTLFVTCNGGGVYRSLDAGQTWEESSNGLGGKVMVDLVMSPRYGMDSTVLALSSEGSVYRTSDAGETWERVSNAADISAISWGGNWIIAGTKTGMLHASENSGSTWSSLGRLPDSPPITTIEVTHDPSAVHRLLVGTAENGDAWALELGESFEPVRLATLGGHVTSLVSLDGLNGSDQRTLLASTWDAAGFRSDDGGASWRTYGSRFMKSDQADEDHVPHFSTIAVADDDSTLFLATFCGVFRSDDAGLSWYRLEVTLHHIVGLDVTRADDSRNAILVATYSLGAYSTSDGGASWKVHNRGLPGPRLGAIAYSPQFALDRTLFASSYSRVFRSQDGGDSWSATFLREPDRGIELIKKALRLAFSRSSILRQKSWFDRLSRAHDEFSEALVFAISPRFSEDQTLFVGSHPSGIWRSVDGGRTFSVLWQTGSAARALAISPSFTEDQTLFAALDDGRLFKSQDGGDNWMQIGKGLPLEDAGQATIAISPDYSRDLTVYAGGKGGLYRSRDDGKTWVRLEGGGLESEGSVTEVAISPNYAVDRRVLVQVRGGRFWICHDREEEFEAIPSQAADDGYGFFQLIDRESAPLIKFSPQYSTDQTVYAASVHHLVKSTDGGMTWETIPRPALQFESEAIFMPWYFLPIYAQGTWSRDPNPEHNCSNAIYATEPGSTVTMTFVGTGVTWIGTRGVDRGVARVYIDGELSAEVDQYSNESTFATTLFSAEDLAYGPHSLTIEVTESRHPESSGYRVDADAFEVFP